MIDPSGPEGKFDGPVHRDQVVGALDRGLEPASHAERAGRTGITREADPLGIKRRLVHELAARLQGARIQRSVAAQRLGLSQRRLSNVLYGYVESVSEGQLFEFLARLGYDIEINVRSTDAWPVERGTVSVQITPSSAGKNF